MLDDAHRNGHDRPRSSDRRAVRHAVGHDDVFTRLTPWLVAVCLTAGLGWLVQSAGDGHVHVTSKGVERHHHGYVGEHSHDAGDHEHEPDESRDSESEGSDSQSGFFAASSVAETAPALPTGLPTFGRTHHLVERASVTPPTRDFASEAQPRAPPAVPVLHVPAAWPDA